MPKSRNFQALHLRHTFGHRLRAAGVSFEDRQDLLGHKSERITTHYSAPDIVRLLEAHLHEHGNHIEFNKYSNGVIIKLLEIQAPVAELQLAP